MFFTQSAAREKIATLQGRITELETNATSQDEVIDTLNRESADKDQTISEHVATIGTLQAAANRVPTLEADLVTARAETETAKKSAGKQASEMLAAAGQAEVIEEGEQKPAENTMTRAEFTALTPKKAMAFIKGGGKITD